jgi:hypothetical protein
MKTKTQAEVTITAGDQEMAQSLPIELPNLCEKDGNAHISVNMGYALPFSKGKASVTITLRCDQDKDMLERAADMAMTMADGLAEEGLRMAYQKVQQLIEEGLME